MKAAPTVQYRVVAVADVVDGKAVIWRFRKHILIYPDTVTPSAAGASRIIIEISRPKKVFCRLAT
jgi:hypothetical protein